MEGSAIVADEERVEAGSVIVDVAVSVIEVDEEEHVVASGTVGEVDPVTENRRGEDSLIADEAHPHRAEALAVDLHHLRKRKLDCTRHGRRNGKKRRGCRR